METINKTILLADESITNTTIFETLLRAKGYQTISVHDGFSAIASISNNKFDTVVFSTTLPVYDGFQLARILATSKSLKTIPVVVYAFENTSVYDFWKQNTKTDIFCTLDNNNPEKLCAAIDQALAIDKTHITEKATTNTKLSATDLLNQSYTRDLFDLYLTRTTLEAGLYLNNMETLILKMIKLLSGICGYDAVCLIIKENTVYEYSDILEELDQTEKDDFFAVSQSDFKTRSMDGRHYEVNKITIIPSNIISRTDKKNTLKLKLQSYQCFELFTDHFLGTLHIAHTQQDYFTGRVQERCTIYAEKLTQILNQLLYTQTLVRAEKTMKKAFSRFVPEQIIDDLIKTDNAYNDTLGENREVAILISDIRNFTNISELNPPETVVSFLNHYFSIMCEVIKNHGGTIDKFIGDAIMALFGATISYKDNTQRAVAAALEMKAKLADIDTSKLVFPPGIKFNMGIGIHFGNVIVGSIGSKDKSDYTVIGDTVNVTSRLESLNKQYGTNIIITDSVQKTLDQNFSARLLDHVKVKGKSKSVKIYSVESFADSFPVDYIKNYQKGLDAYMIGGWQLAITYFEKALKSVPDDCAAKLLRDRCYQFIENPPKMWDGAISLTTK
jgi:class 3 adenylate cyclase/CheY-like chemotaxis protein